MSQIIAERLEELGMNANQLGLMSDMSYSHVVKIINGATRKPGRDKLIRIGTALSWEIKEINELMAFYGHENITEDDAFFFIQAAKIKNFQSKAFLNMRYSRALSGLVGILRYELIPGNFKFFLGYPLYLTWGDYFPMYWKYEDAISKKIKKILFEYRKKVVKNMLETYDTQHLLCKDCLIGFINSCKKSIEASEVANIFYYFFKTITEFEKYYVGIVSTCHPFDFIINNPLDKEVRPFVDYSGKIIHNMGKEVKPFVDYIGKNVGMIQYILSNSPEIYNAFNSDFDKLKNNIICDTSDRQQLIDYIVGLLKDNGIEMGDVSARLKDYKIEDIVRGY